MTPKQTAKQYCDLTISEIARIHEVSRRTLDNWCKTKPKVFKGLCIAASLYQRM